jgi:hypothetical protein
MRVIEGLRSEVLQRSTAMSATLAAAAHRKRMLLKHTMGLWYAKVQIGQWSSDFVQQQHQNLLLQQLNDKLKLRPADEELMEARDVAARERAARQVAELAARDSIELEGKYEEKNRNLTAQLRKLQNEYNRLRRNSEAPER